MRWQQSTLNIFTIKRKHQPSITTWCYPCFLPFSKAGRYHLCQEAFLIAVNCVSSLRSKPQGIPVYFSYILMFCFLFFFFWGRGLWNSCLPNENTLMVGILFFWHVDDTMPSCRLYLADRSQSIVVVHLLSHVRLFAIPWTVPARLLCPWDSPGKNTGVGCHFLLRS